jgi:hypothetical protein
MSNEPANSKTSLTPAENPPTSGTPHLSLAGSGGAAGSILVGRMGFTKLDEGILQSSILLEDDATFKVFMVLLAACKSNGIARVSPVFLASILNKPIDTVMECIKKLEQPDPYSRSINDEGRRIRRVDGGYEIINYLKYRDTRVYSDNKEAEKKRKQRKRNINELDAQKGTLEGHTRDISASPSHSSSGIIKKEEDIKEKEDFEKLIDYWQGCKNTVTHQVITKKMISVVKDRLKEYALKELGYSILYYDKMMGDGRNFYGKYSHGLDEFFRDGIKKPAPFAKFLPERNPLEKLWIKEEPADDEECGSVKFNG